MSRAEMRRAEKQKASSKKTFVMTREELDKIRRQEYERARATVVEESSKLADDIFLMMLAIPTNVLAADYWQKSAKKRIPEFVQACLSLYKSWEEGAVSMTEMQKLTEEYAGIELIRKGTAVARSVARRKGRGID